MRGGDAEEQFLAGLGSAERRVGSADLRGEAGSRGGDLGLGEGPVDRGAGERGLSAAEEAEFPGRIEPRLVHPGGPGLGQGARLEAKPLEGAGVDALPAQGAADPGVATHREPREQTRRGRVFRRAGRRDPFHRLRHARASRERAADEGGQATIAEPTPELRAGRARSRVAAAGPVGPGCREGGRRIRPGRCRTAGKEGRCDERREADATCPTREAIDHHLTLYRTIATVLDAEHLRVKSVRSSRIGRTRAASRRSDMAGRCDGGWALLTAITLFVQFGLPAAVVAE